MFDPYELTPSRHLQAEDKISTHDVPFHFIFFLSLLSRIIAVHLSGLPEESATCWFDRGRADPALGEEWSERASLGESTHKWQAQPPPFRSVQCAV
jgi:hypothetical protein